MGHSYGEGRLFMNGEEECSERTFQSEPGEVVLEVVNSRKEHLHV